MEYTSVQKLARVLKVMILIVFVINIIALLLVPALIMFSSNPSTGEWVGVEYAVREFVDFWNYEADDALANIFYAPIWVFGMHPRIIVLVLFLWACGCCSAIMLWQAKRVVESVVEEDTFSFANAANMKRAAICCFGISAAALIRLIWGVIFYKSSMPIFSYNTLFIPVFAVAGLVCIVMSALFRQAAELKAENDLTI